MTRRSAAIPDLVGQAIDDGRLQITSTLGAGSNGVVFLATDTTSSPVCPTQYAVKCILKAKEGTRRYHIQKQEIANHLKASCHPNVLTLHRVVEDGVFLFLVMDYCSGGDLFQFLFDHRVRRGDDAMVKKLMLQIIDAVDACHQLGIYHRDVKPENLLCSEDGSRIFLCDFGLSTRRPYSTTFGAGSSYYMSPECMNVDGLGRPYSSRANDIWALGVILTAMISGHNPWRRAVYGDACYRAYVHDPEFLLRTLPISVGTNDILRSIFTTDASRIELPFLRLMILQTETFYARIPSKSPSQRRHRADADWRIRFWRVGRSSVADASGKMPPHTASMPSLGHANGYPRHDSLHTTPTEIDSGGPTTPDPTRENLYDMPECLDVGGRTQFFAPLDTSYDSRRAQAKSHGGIFRRMAGRLSLF